MRCAASAPREGTHGPRARPRAARPGITRAALQAFFATGLVCPVLTAHPTEVRRKSTIDREMEVAQLLAERDRSRAHARGGGGQRGGAAPRRADPVADQHAAPDQARRSSTRWRTASPTTTTPSCASCRASMRRSRTSSPRPTRPGTARSCPRSCAWEAGSAATATAIPSSRPRCCARRCACRAGARSSFYLDELHLLGGELSLDGRLVGVSDELQALAERSPDRSPHRQRRALSARHLRHLCAARGDGAGARTG